MRETRGKGREEGRDEWHAAERARYNFSPAIFNISFSKCHYLPATYNFVIRYLILCCSVGKEGKAERNSIRGCGARNSRIKVLIAEVVVIIAIIVEVAVVVVALVVWKY